ncbi:MAG: TlpA disulfide reductase family protein [Chitinophagales bacterium]|nr:TlpA family protein disulfide reductase [Bacteroidota bacterium]
MKKLGHFVPFLLLLLVVFAASCNTQKVDIGSLQVQNLSGETVELNEVGGKVMLLNFWATWCGPCVAEKPKLAVLQKILAPKGYEFVMVSDENIDKIRTYAQRHSYGFRYLKSMKSIKLYGVFSIPQTYIVKNGKVVATFNGGQDWTDPTMIQLLEDFLK